MQADSDRAWYEGEMGRRQAAQAAAQAQLQQEKAQRKVVYQDLQASAVVRRKEAQLQEHRYPCPSPMAVALGSSVQVDKMPPHTRCWVLC